MKLSVSASQHRPARWLVLGCLLATFHLGCSHGGGGGGTSSMLQLSFSTTPPPGGQADVVWLADGGLIGGMQIVEVMAQNIDTAFDRCDLEIGFDPLVAQAVSMTNGSFLADCTDSPFELSINNVRSGPSGANSTARIIFSTSLPAGIAGCAVPSAGVLARIAFRAGNAGSSLLMMLPCDDTDPSNLTGSCLTSGDPAVKDPDVQFLDTGATLVSSE